MSQEFDIIICGAGPAGCTAALALGSSGLKTGLIDKEHFPREKVCGDAIPAYVPKVLKTINIAYSSEFERIGGGIKVDTCRIVAPNGKNLDLKYNEYGYIWRRQFFDSFLFDLAVKLPNITLFSETRIKDISVNADEAVINTDKDLILRSRLVIGCDGAHSIVRRNLTDIRIDPHHSSGAVRAYFKNVRGSQDSTFELHFLRHYLPGYFWIFPLPDNYSNVGLGMPSVIIAKRKISLKREMQRIIETVPYLRDRFSDATITGGITGYLLPLGSHKIPISGNRFLLCGDAASLIDPATGAGIGQAMISGRYAGWHALKCFEKNDFSKDFMKGYDRVVYNKLWTENRRRLIIRDVFLRNPRIFNTLISLALKSNFIKKTIVKTLN